MRHVLFLGALLLGACHGCDKGHCPNDMSSADLARPDLAPPLCLPPAAVCDPIKPPACCDGIACGVSGHCLVYDAGAP